MGVLAPPARPAAPAAPAAHAQRPAEPGGSAEPTAATPTRAPPPPPPPPGQHCGSAPPAAARHAVLVAACMLCEARADHRLPGIKRSFCALLWPAARAGPPPPPPPPAGRQRPAAPAAPLPPASSAAVDPGPAPSVKLRTFFWDRLPAARVGGTFWEAHPPDYALLDRPAVEALFQAAIRRPGSAGATRQQTGGERERARVLPHSGDDCPRRGLALFGRHSPPSAGPARLLRPSCTACSLCSPAGALAAPCCVRPALSASRHPLQHAPPRAAPPGASRRWRRWTRDVQPTLASSWRASGARIELAGWRGPAATVAWVVWWLTPWRLALALQLLHARPAFKGCAFEG